MDPSKILSAEEVTAAADLFFPLFNIVRERMPENSNVEDALKVMENVCQVAIKLRTEKENPMGFNKLDFNSESNPE